MRAFFRLAVVNLLVLLGLVLGFNLLAAVVLDVNRMMERRAGAADGRLALPIFDDDRATAAAAFADLSQIRFDYKPFLEWAPAPFDGKVTKIGADGLRAVPGGGTAGEPVRLFGGSTMWGTGVSDAQTIPGQVALLLPGRPVVNHAQSGYVSRQGLEALVNLVNQGKPVGTVIFYDGVNDVFVGCSSAISVNGHIQEPRMRAAIDAGGVERSWLRDLLFGASLPFARRVVDKLAFELGGAPILDTGPQGAPSRCRDNAAEAERIADTLIANWRLAARMTRDAGGSFLAVLQPVAYQGKPSIAHLTLEPGMGQDYAAVYPVLQRKLASMTDFTVVDLSAMYDGPAAHYMDWAHVNAAGNAKMAEAIVAAARGKGLLP